MPDLSERGIVQVQNAPDERPVMNPLDHNTPMKPALSGLDSLRAVIAGDSPSPTIWAVMNFTMTHVEPGSVTLEGSPQEEHGNLIGMTHGGWYATLLDSAVGGAVNSTMDKGQKAVTLELKINIMRPIPVGVPVRAIGVADHVGRSTGVARAEIHGIEDGKLYANASTTMMVLT